MRAARASGSLMWLLRRLERRDATAFARELLVVLLPARRPVRRRNLHCRDLVFRTIGRPVGEVRGDDVRLRVRMMERGIDHAGGDLVGDQGPQGRLAGTAREPHPVAVAYAALFGIVRMNLEDILGMPRRVGGAPRL